MPDIISDAVLLIGFYEDTDTCIGFPHFLATHFPARKVLTRKADQPFQPGKDIFDGRDSPGLIALG